jgi:hypothetical protein
MQLRRKRGTDARNVLFDAALEFGDNWRRDVSSLATERLPHMGSAERAVIAEEISEARVAIEEWIVERWNAINGHWSKAHSDAALAFIAEAYPWMHERNASRAVHQGTYYAWHG